MSMSKRHREIEAMLKRTGLTVVEFSRTGGGHIGVVAEAPNGKTKKFSVSSTPSDFKSDRNQEQWFRRFAGENPAAPLTQVAAAMAQVVAKTARTLAPVVATPAPTPIPQPTPAAPAQATMTKPAPKIERTTITHAQFFKLCEWIKNATLDGVHTRVEAARRASADLGFAVSENSVKTALETVGKELQPAPESQTAKRDRNLIIARELAQLMRELGKEPSDELLSILRREAA